MRAGLPSFFAAARSARSARACARNSSAMRVLFLAPAPAHRRARALSRQRLVARQELLHLQRVVGERLRGGVDGGQAAADHDDRQADLQIGDRVGLGRTGELQRHQEVRRGAHAAREAVGQLQHRRAAGARRHRDVVEAQRERILGAERSAEAHATEHGELAAPLQQQADELEEVLVPAHRDAVLGHAAEAGHDAVVERLVQRLHVADRLERHALPALIDARNFRGQRLDLEPVDAHHHDARRS